MAAKSDKHFININCYFTRQGVSMTTFIRPQGVGTHNSCKFEFAKIKCTLCGMNAKIPRIITGKYSYHYYEKFHNHGPIFLQNGIKINEINCQEKIPETDIISCGLCGMKLRKSKSWGNTVISIHTRNHMNSECTGTKDKIGEHERVYELSAEYMYKRIKEELSIEFKPTDLSSVMGDSEYKNIVSILLKEKLCSCGFHNNCVCVICGMEKKLGIDSWHTLINSISSCHFESNKVRETNLYTVFIKMRRGGDELSVTKKNLTIANASKSPVKFYCTFCNAEYVAAGANLMSLKQIDYPCQEIVLSHVTMCMPAHIEECRLKTLKCT